MNDDNNSINFITLNDVSQRFSKKIKKQLKKRKKIQKLKELLRLQRLKINKNLVDSLVQRMFKAENNNNEMITIDNLNNTISSSYNNNKISQLMESTTSVEGESTSIQNNAKFDLQSLKIISSESFMLKSYYKNINSLSKGKIIKSLKFKKKLENIIKKTINKNNRNKNSSILFISTIIPKNKNDEYFFVNSKNNEIDIKIESND